MGGSKITLAREAVIQALRMLRDTDRFSVIAYDNEIDVIVPSTRATPEAVRNGADRVKELQARGSTRSLRRMAEGLRADRRAPGSRDDGAVSAHE